MKNESIINKNHWNGLNKDYSKVWTSKARQAMSDKETGFIVKFLNIKKPKNTLDIGVGNGRILNIIFKNCPRESNINGIDIADNMVKICQDKFYKESNLGEIKVCNISEEEIPFRSNFDFVSAIRILKYNRNWKDILQKIYNHLERGAYFVFTMPNINSVSFFYQDTFSSDRLPVNYSNKKELKEILESIGYEICEIRGFTKIPEVFYLLSNNKIYTKLLLISEKFLELIFGRTLFSRILFVACFKK